MKAPIRSCEAKECLYCKEGHCHAPHIKVAASHAQCEMFTRSVMRYINRRDNSYVEHCRMRSCKWNRHGSCSAHHVDIKYHVDHADCGTYMIRVAAAS